MSARERESGLIHLQMSDQQTNSFSLSLLQTEEIQDKDKSHKDWCFSVKKVRMTDTRMCVCVSAPQQLNSVSVCTSGLRLQGRCMATLCIYVQHRFMVHRLINMSLFQFLK